MINISHLGEKAKSSSKVTFNGDMLVSGRVYFADIHGEFLQLGIFDTCDGI